MADYIDRASLGIGKANRKIFKVPEYADGWNEALDYIFAFPSEDVVPVVRCRDCKFLGFKDFRGICEYGPICGPITPDSFCSWGKRKKEDDDG